MQVPSCARSGKRITDDEILAAAQRLQAEGGYVTGRDLAEAIGYSYAGTMKRVWRIMYRQEWPYKWSSKPRRNPDSIFNRARILFTERPDITTGEVLVSLGIDDNKKTRHTIRGYLSWFRKRGVAS